MVDTNGFNKIQAAANKTKTFVKDGTWDIADQGRGWTQYIIRREISNINFYNVLKKVKPRYLQSSKRMSSRHQGITFFHRQKLCI